MPCYIPLKIYAHDTVSTMLEKLDLNEAKTILQSAHLFFSYTISL